MTERLHSFNFLLEVALFFSMDRFQNVRTSAWFTDSFMF